MRTHISDDRVWLAHCVADYVKVSGDAAVLDEQVPFLTGPPLPPQEADAFYVPEPSSQTGSLRDHCARGLDMAIALTAENGLPLIGTGDWNDGMNRVGAGGKGSSVWLGWFLGPDPARHGAFGPRLCRQVAGPCAGRERGHRNHRLGRRLVSPGDL